jgi:hypothetical protein
MPYKGQQVKIGTKEEARQNLLRLINRGKEQKPNLSKT